MAHRRTLTEKYRPMLTVVSRMLDHDHPPTPNQGKKGHQHKSSYIHVPTFSQSTVAQSTPWSCTLGPEAHVIDILGALGLVDPPTTPEGTSNLIWTLVGSTVPHSGILTYPMIYHVPNKGPYLKPLPKSVLQPPRNTKVQASS